MAFQLSQLKRNDVSEAVCSELKRAACHVAVKDYPPKIVFIDFIIGMHEQWVVVMLMFIVCLYMHKTRQFSQ